METLEGVSPDWVGSLSEEDVLPAGTEAKEGSLLIADKGTAGTTPCISALAAAMHLPPARDQPGLHASRFQRSRCLRAYLHAVDP